MKHPFFCSLYTVHKTTVKIDSVCTHMMCLNCMLFTCTQDCSEDRLHPISTGIGDIENELYLSMHTYDALELRLTR